MDGLQRHENVDFVILSSQFRGVQKDVAVYKLHEDICTEGVCDAMQEDVFIYRDAGHSSKEGSAYLGRQNAWMENFRRMAGE